MTAAADAENLEYAREVVASGLAAGALTVDPLDVEPFIQLIAERTQHRDAPGTIAERAAADRTWQFGHVIVDEAQELSPMEWRMLMPGKPASRSPKGPGGDKKSKLEGGSQSHPAEPNLDEQGQQGNININTHNQGYQQDR